MLHDAPSERGLKSDIADFEQAFGFVHPVGEQDFRIRNRQEQRRAVGSRHIQPIRLFGAYGGFLVLAAATFYVSSIAPVSAGHIQELMNDTNRRMA